MKKLIAILMAAAMVLSLAACSSKNSSPDETTKATEAVTDEVKDDSGLDNTYDRIMKISEKMYSDSLSSGGNISTDSYAQFLVNSVNGIYNGDAGKILGIIRTSTNYDGDAVYDDSLAGNYTSVRFDVTSEEKLTDKEIATYVELIKAKAEKYEKFADDILRDETGLAKFAEGAGLSTEDAKTVLTYTQQYYALLEGVYVSEGCSIHGKWVGVSESGEEVITSSTSTVLYADGKWVDDVNIYRAILNLFTMAGLDKIYDLY